MLEELDLKQKMPKDEYKKAKSELTLALSVKQQEIRRLAWPVAIVFEGWDAAGKGRLINELIQPLDPRGFNFHSAFAPDENARCRPFLWRFWLNVTAGRFAVFDRSWYRRVLNDRVDGDVSGKQLSRAYNDILAFERQLPLQDAWC